MNGPADWIGIQQVTAEGWQQNQRTSGHTVIDSTVSGITSGAALAGDTDAASSVQPSFVCRYVIRAA